MDTAEMTTETSAPAAAGQVTDCLIHVRFKNDATVIEIGERPQGVEAQTWFNFLSQNTMNHYRALSGGRGMFRLPRSEVEALQAACVEGAKS